MYLKKGSWGEGGGVFAVTLICLPCSAKQQASGPEAESRTGVGKLGPNSRHVVHSRGLAPIPRPWRQCQSLCVQTSVCLNPAQRQLAAGLAAPSSHEVGRRCREKGVETPWRQQVTGRS